jgi:hypothetical protein
MDGPCPGKERSQFRGLFLELLFKLAQCFEFLGKRWSCFLRQAVKVDSAMKRVIHHEDAETVFG